MQFSRVPSDYRPDPKGHFHKQKSKRNVPGPAIRECIENGEKVPDPDDKHSGVRLRAKWGGVAYWVALKPRRGIIKSCGLCG